MTDPQFRNTGEPAGESALQSGASVKDEAKTAAGDVAATAREQAREVTSEARTQARQMGRQLREKVGAETESQAHRLAENLRQWSDDLSGMADSSKPDAAPRDVVFQIANAGRSAADYLDEHGVGGAMQEVEGFARRRPGAFLIGAALAGFAVGRLAKASRQAPAQTSQAPMQTSQASAQTSQGPAAPYPTASDAPTRPGYAVGASTSQRR